MDVINLNIVQGRKIQYNNLYYALNINRTTYNLIGKFYKNIIKIDINNYKHNIIKK